jgi:starvation-inducible outer membrane lipoprotein
MLKFHSIPSKCESNLFQKAQKFTEEQVNLEINNDYTKDLIQYYFNNFLKRNLSNYDLWNIEMRYNVHTHSYDFDIWKNEYLGA